MNDKSTCACDKGSSGFLVTVYQSTTLAHTHTHIHTHQLCWGFVRQVVQHEKRPLRSRTVDITGGGGGGEKEDEMDAENGIECLYVCLSPSLSLLASSVSAGCLAMRIRSASVLCEGSVSE